MATKKSKYNPYIFSTSKNSTNPYVIKTRNSGKTSDSNSISKQVNNLQTRLKASGADTDKRNWLQKALNLEEGMGFLAGLGDVLDRVSLGASVRAMIAGDNKKDSLQNFWEGLTGEQRVSGADVLESFSPDFKKSSGVSRFVGSLLTEVLLDPTTYLTLGASALGKQALKGGAKAIGAVDNVADLTKMMKATKTIDQANTLVKNADRASDFLRYSNQLRKADIADTIANPLSLAFRGAKKAGKAGMNLLEAKNPTVANSLKTLGGELKKTFNFKGYLKKLLPQGSYDRLVNIENISELSERAITDGTADIFKYLDNTTNMILKDPDRVWTITSKATGETADFTFKGMSRDEIFKKLNEFLTNQIYFDRPTILNEETLTLLARNKGRLMLPIQNFKNSTDLDDLRNLLKNIVDDPDKVVIDLYKPLGSDIGTGYIIDIGQKNANTFLSNLYGADDALLIQQGKVAKATKTRNVAKAQYAKVSKVENARISKNQIQLDNISTKATKVQERIQKSDLLKEELTKRYDKASSKFKRTVDIQDELINNRIAKVEQLTNEKQLLQMDLDNATVNLKWAKQAENTRTISIWQKEVDNLTKRINKRTDDIAKLDELLTQATDIKNKAIKSIDEGAKHLTDRLQDIDLRKTKLESTLDNYAKRTSDITEAIGRAEARTAKSANYLNDTISALDITKTSLADAKKRVSDIRDLFKPRELVPYDSPIINIEGMAETADIQRKTMAQNLGNQNYAGLNVDELDKYSSYVHKVLTPESRAYLQRHKGEMNPVMSYIMGATDRIPSQVPRSNIYSSFSPVEVNQMMARDLFDTNIITSNLNLAKQQNRTLYNSTLLKELFTSESDVVKKITNQMSDLDFYNLTQNGFEIYDGATIARKLYLPDIIGEEGTEQFLKSLRGNKYAISSDVVDLFHRNKNLYDKIDTEFYKSLNKLMKYWKGGNLLSVGYHFRNIIGAQTNMALAGMPMSDVAKYTAQAGLDVNEYNTKLLPKFNDWLKNSDNANVFKHGTVADIKKSLTNFMGDKEATKFLDLYDAQLKGVWGGATGQASAIKRAISEVPQSRLGKFADKVQDINYKLGATSDDIHRLASYRWAKNPDNLYKISKVGAQNAVDFVNYAMFDFKAMSQTEQVYFTKIFPFYNFIKNNLAFQMTNILNNSQKYKTLARAYNNIYEAQGLTDDDVQSYVKDQLYIPIRKSDGTMYVIKIGAPVQDATNLLTAKGLLGASNPIIQYVTDRAYNQDLYTGKALESDRTQNVQELTDVLPYGRMARQLINNPLQVLLPVSKTTVEKANLQNAYAELEKLEQQAQAYKRKTGKKLPTLKELGL